MRWQATRQPGIWAWAPRASGANHTISRFFSFLVYFLFNPQVVLHHPFEKATWPISHVIWRRPNVVRLARSTPRTRDIGDCQRGRILYEPHWMDGCVCVAIHRGRGGGLLRTHTRPRTTYGVSVVVVPPLDDHGREKKNEKINQRRRYP